MVTVLQNLGNSIIQEQTNLLDLQQKQLRFYQIRLEWIRLEAEAELARVETEGGLAGFPERICRLAEARP